MLSVQDVMVIGKTFLFHSKLPIFPMSDVKRNKSSNKGIVVHIISTLACVIKLFN